MSKQMTWILIIIALLVGLYAGYYYEKQKLNNLMSVQRADMQRQIDDAKMLNKQVRPTVIPKDI
jgi:uncharacterized membrane-anchored protein YhcB (DUF1043 family)